MSFRVITVDEVGFGQVHQAMMESVLPLFNMVVRHLLRPLSAPRKERRQGDKTRKGHTRRERRTADIADEHPDFEQKDAAGNGAKCGRRKSYNANWSVRHTKCNMACCSSAPG